MDKKIEIAKRLADKDFRTLDDDALWLAELVMREHLEEMKTFQIRPFTKVDWYGFAGATPFKTSDGTEEEPIIGIYEPNVLVIGDATGLNVDYMKENGDSIETFHFEAKPDQEWNQACAIQLAKQLVPFNIYIIRLLAKSNL
jgi:hypothetical protein